MTDYEGTIGVPAGQCYHCHTGAVPSGSRRRIRSSGAARGRGGAERVYNFLHTLTLEVQMLARACGKTTSLSSPRTSAR